MGSVIGKQESEVHTSYSRSLSAFTSLVYLQVYIQSC